MSLNYTVYSQISSNDLERLLSSWKDRGEIFIGAVHPMERIDHEILAEEGFSGSFQTRVTIRLKKEERDVGKDLVRAVGRVLRGSGDCLILLNQETELDF